MDGGGEAEVTAQDAGRVGDQRRELLDFTESEPEVGGEGGGGDEGAGAGARTRRRQEEEEEERQGFRRPTHSFGSGHVTLDEHRR